LLLITRARLRSSLSSRRRVLIELLDQLALLAERAADHHRRPCRIEVLLEVNLLDLSAPRLGGAVQRRRQQQPCKSRTIAAADLASSSRLSTIM